MTHTESPSVRNGKTTLVLLPGYLNQENQGSAGEEPGMGITAEGDVRRACTSGRPMAVPSRWICPKTKTLPAVPATSNVVYSKSFIKPPFPDRMPVPGKLHTITSSFYRH